MQRSRFETCIVQAMECCGKEGMSKASDRVWKYVEAE